jgi:hypothetical protein
MNTDDSILSDEDLDTIRRRCDSATAGPWKSFIEGRDHLSGDSFIQTGDTERSDIYLSGATDADQDFVAHARLDIPRLLREIARLKRLREP